MGLSLKPLSDRVVIEAAAAEEKSSGGIILPELHYGRDALVGIALFLSHLSREKLC